MPTQAERGSFSHSFAKARSTLNVNRRVCAPVVPSSSVCWNATSAYGVSRRGDDAGGLFVASSRRNEFAATHVYRATVALNCCHETPLDVRVPGTAVRTHVTASSVTKEGAPLGFSTNTDTVLRLLPSYLTTTSNVHSFSLQSNPNSNSGRDMVCDHTAVVPPPTYGEHRGRCPSSASAPTIACKYVRARSRGAAKTPASSILASRRARRPAEVS